MTENTTDAKFASVLHKIRKLLDTADHPNTTPEMAATYRAKAEHLMREYRVEEEQAVAQDPQAMAPVTQQMDITDSAEFGQQYYSLFHWIAEHCGVRVRAAWAYDPTRRVSVIKATVVGYASDIRLAELLYTNARIAFSEHLEPKPEPGKDQLNCYRMRRAGMERNRIANILWGSAFDDGPAHGKVAKLYKAECEVRGEKPALSGRGVNAKLYRTEYADAFAFRIYSRLREARQGADKIGGLPALHGRQERVDEAFYAIYPDARPKPAGEVVKTSGKVKPVKARKISKSDEAAWRRTQRPEAVAARSAGRDAADTVAIDGSEQARRVDRYTAEERDDTRQIWQALGQ